MERLAYVVAQFEVVTNFARGKRPRTETGQELFRRVTAALSARLLRRKLRTDSYMKTNDALLRIHPAWGVYAVN